MTCLPEDGVGQQETALAGEATRASTGGSAGGGGRAEGRVGGKKKVGGGGKAKAKAIARKSSRLAFSDLKHDVREERMYRANAGGRGLGDCIYFDLGCRRVEWVRFCCTFFFLTPLTFTI